MRRSHALGSTTTALLALILAGVVPTVAATGAAGAQSPGQAVSDHLDEPPPGVDVHKPVSTTELIERSGVRRRPAVFTKHRTSAPSATRTAAGESADPTPIPLLSVPGGTAVLGGLGAHVSPSCSGTSGNRVQVIYARESGTASRYAALLPTLRSYVADVDDTFALSSRTSGRRARWVHNASCVPVVPEVVVPNGALRGNYGLDSLATHLAAIGHDRPDRKYLVFAEANALCGIGEYILDRRASASNYSNGGQAMYARVDTGCWATSADYHSTAAHELLHMLGAVQPEAPHATTNGHCTDEADVMCYDDGSGQPMVRTCTATGSEALLDCRHDDYFDDRATSTGYLATSWNTAHSSFLDTVQPLASSTAPTSGSSTPVAVTVGLAAPTTLYVGRTGWVRATVAAATGPVATGVRLQAYAASTGWRTIATTTSSASGIASFSVRSDTATTVSVRAVVPATTKVAEARSVTRAIKVVRQATATSAAVTVGRPNTLTGALRTSSGVMVANRYLTLQRRYAGITTWTTVTQRLTGSTGKVSISVQPRRRTSYRWVFPGGARLAGSASAAVTVTY